MAFNAGGKDLHAIFKLRTQVQKNVRNIKTNSVQQASAPPAPILVQGKSAITGGFEFQFSPIGGSQVAGYKVYKSLVNSENTAQEIDYIAQPPLGQNKSLTYQHITAGSYFFWVAAVNDAGKTGRKVPMAGAPEPIPISGTSGSGNTTGGNTSAGSGIGSGGGAAGGGGRKSSL